MRHCTADEVTVFADSKQVIVGREIAVSMQGVLDKKLENSIMQHAHMLNSSYPNTPTYKQYVKSVIRKK